MSQKLPEIWNLAALGEKVCQWTDRPEWIQRHLDMTFALLQGTDAGKSEYANGSRDCCYSIGSAWRWAWQTGFDLGRRIDARDKTIARLQSIITANQQSYTESSGRLIADREELKAELHRVEHKLAATQDESEGLRAENARLRLRLPRERMGEGDEVVSD